MRETQIDIEKEIPMNNAAGKVSIDKIVEHSVGLPGY